MAILRTCQNFMTLFVIIKQSYFHLFAGHWFIVFCSWTSSHASVIYMAYQEILLHIMSNKSFGDYFELFQSDCHFQVTTKFYHYYLY